MRSYNHIYKSNETLKEFLKETELEDSGRILVRIHSAIHTHTEINDMIGSIHSILPSANIIGCSTSHIILGGEIIYKACLVSVTEFDDASIQVDSLSCFDDEGKMLKGHEVAERVLNRLQKTDKEKFMMVFFPISFARIEAFVDTVNNSGKSIKMLGGTAYLDDETPENPCYVIAGNRAKTKDVAFACVTLPDTSVTEGYACGVEAVGKKSQIKVKGTMITKVDGIEGGEWYSSLLGKEALDENPAIAESFPLVMRDGSNVAYHVDYKKDENSGSYVIETFPELRNGISISPGYFHPQKIFDQVSRLVDNVAKNPSEVVFGYDCYARNSLLSNCAKWENEIFASTGISGCLLSGEISHHNGKNLYANLTFVVASLSDDKSAFLGVEKPDVAAIQMLQEENVKPLNFLLSNAMRSMSEELTTQKDMFRDAVFFNPAVGIDNQLKFQYDSEAEALDKVAVLYLTNEKMMRLFSGVSDTYASLTSCYEDVINRFDDAGFYFYSYQETSLMVAANDNTSNEEFEQIVDEIQDYLNTKIYGDIKLSYISVTLINADDPLSTLELALDYAKSHKLKRIRNRDIESNLEKEQEKIKILWVIREALSHKRVVPYFQEIHSNKPGKRRLYEALMRITDENGKLYFPDSFLPVSKEYSLYDKLSELMVSTVMDMFMNKEARVTINLNVNDIYNRNMIKMIFKKLAKAPNPQNFVFEIVESEEITDYEFIESFADRIHECGSKIAIDDFGSGFSNMLHLLRIDADYIKIDGAIIRDILRDPHVKDLVKFMQNWCENNNQALICEFIENKEIQDLMEEYGVAYSQGYYYSKPHAWTPEDE